jgi:hypothetical protein
MSDIPLLDLLTNGTPTPGSISEADFIAFVRSQLALASNIDVPGSTATALYAGMFGKVPAYQIAQDMAERSGGKLRIIDNSNIGKFLNYMLYGEGKTLLAFRPEPDFITDRFKEASYAFAKATRGPVITITPTSGKDSVFALGEIDGLLDGSDVSSVNGRAMTDVRVAYAGRNSDSSRAYFKAIFDGDFADAVAAQKNAVVLGQSDADGRPLRGALTLDSTTLVRLGIGNISLTSSPILTQELDSSTLLGNLRPARANKLTFDHYAKILGSETDLSKVLGRDIVDGDDKATAAARRRTEELLVDLDERTDVDQSKSLSELQRSYLRTFRSTDDKIAKYSSYVITHTEALAKLVDDGLAKIPTALKESLTQLLSLYKKADGSVHKSRVALTVGGGVLALAELWVEADKRGGFTSPDFLDYLKATAKDAVVALPATGAALYGASLTPLGPAVFVTLGAVGVYTGVRKVLDHVIEKYKPATGETSSLLYTQAKELNDFFIGLEGSVSGFFGSAIKEIAETSTQIFSKLVMDNVQIVGGEAATIVSDKNEFVFGQDLSLIVGDEKNNVLIHTGAGEAYGEAGNDILIGWKADFIRKGDKIDPNNPDSARADKDHHLTLDGSSGNDWVVAIGGQKAITVGGLGRDWIYNTSAGGQLYGDTQSGLDAQSNKIADDAGNGDNFWYAPDTTIMDAQHHDVLKFYGLTLTGGNVSGGAVFAATTLGFGTAATGLAAWANSIDPKTGKHDPTRGLFFDHVLPGVVYMYKHTQDGRGDLYVTDMFSQTFSRLFGGASTGTGQAANTGLAGWQRIRNFDMVGSWDGKYQSSLNDHAGTLNMVFKQVNIVNAILSLLPPTLIGTALMGGGALVDEALTLSAAVRRFAKGLAWADGADPLVLDLDGDGLETIALEDSAAYFDGDGDLFAERTGWLGGDDGFLVWDKNSNGRVDDGSELFGSATQGGFAALSAYDSNGDGKISAADAMWNALRVWQDKNSDGASQANELKSLAALGILSINLGTTALGVTTPQGTQLLARGSFTRADGSTGRAYDAIFDTNATDTRYTGERGAAPWAPATAINAKGGACPGQARSARSGGRLTDLRVAMNNDVDLAALASSTAASMTSANLKTLRAQSGALLGAWGATQEQTRELVAVQLDSDGVGTQRPMRGVAAHRAKQIRPRAARTVCNDNDAQLRSVA